MSEALMSSLSAVKLAVYNGWTYLSQLELAAATSVQQSAFSAFASVNRFSSQYVGQELIELMRKIEAICLNILTCVATALLFFYSSGFFTIGGCVGVTCTETMVKMITDIKSVVGRIMREKDFTHLALMITGGVLAFSITMPVSAFFVGGYYGVIMKNPSAFDAQPVNPEDLLPDVVDPRDILADAVDAPFVAAPAPPVEAALFSLAG